MRITRRQLNKIISESLGIQNRVITESVNFRKIRKDLFALKDDIDNQDLLDKVTDHAEKLRTKVDSNKDPKFFKGRYQEAVTLLTSLEDLLKAPTPEKVKKVIKTPIIDKPPTPAPEPDPKPWNPDPDPKVNWEYQVRECVWFTRKKEATKEYKLGHASGKPLEKGGKFLNTIVKLNNAYSELVKDCDPMVKKPTPKPGKKAMVWPENAINLIKTTKMPGEQDLTGIPDWKESFQDACSFYIKTNGRSLAEFYQGMNPGIKFTSVHEWLALEEFQNSRDGRDVAESLIDAVNEMSKEAASKLKGLNNHDSELNPLSGDQMNESLSRGSLYRNRYRRY